MTAADIDAARTDEIVAERAGVLALARTYAGQIDGMLARRRLADVDAAMLKECIRCFGDMVATGLHREGDNPREVRARMREVVRA